MSYINKRKQAARKTPPFSLQKLGQHYALHLFWLKKLMFIGIILLLISVTLLWLVHPRTLPITTLHIKGHYHTSLAVVKKVVSPYLQVGFFHLDQDALKLALLNLPWIKKVDTKLTGFDTLLIQIQEHKAVARWQKNDLIDEEGQIFQANLSEKLPHFYGQKDNIPSLLFYYEKFTTLLEKKGLKIQALSCNARQAWYIVLENNVQLLLGREQIQARLQRFLQVYKRIMQIPYVTRIDLRYTNGIAVQTALVEE